MESQERSLSVEDSTIRALAGTAEQPADNVVPRLELALRLAASTNDERVLEDATRRIAALGRDVAERIALLTIALRTAPKGHERDAVVEQIRKLVRA